MAVNSALVVNQLISARLGILVMLFHAVCWSFRLLCLHDGHGHGAPGEGASFWHYLVEPEHWPVTIATILAVSLIAGLGYWQICRILNRSSRRIRNTERLGLSMRRIGRS